MSVALAHTFRTVKYQVPRTRHRSVQAAADGLASCRHLLQLAKHRGVDGIFLYHLLRQVAFLPVLVHIGVGFVILTRLRIYLYACLCHSLSHLFFWVAVCRHKPPSVLLRNTAPHIQCLSPLAAATTCTRYVATLHVAFQRVRLHHGVSAARQLGKRHAQYLVVVLHFLLSLFSFLRFSPYIVAQHMASTFSCTVLMSVNPACSMRSTTSPFSSFNSSTPVFLSPSHIQPFSKC